MLATVTSFIDVLIKLGVLGELESELIPSGDQPHRSGTTLVLVQNANCQIVMLMYTK